MGKNWDVPCGADLNKAADAGGAGHGAAEGKGTISLGQGTPGPPAASPLAPRCAMETPSTTDD